MLEQVVMQMPLSHQNVSRNCDMRGKDSVKSTDLKAQRSIECSGIAGPHRSRRTRQVPCLALRAC